jgi:uncharacterized protein YecT (DUF1311 family)
MRTSILLVVGLCAYASGATAQQFNAIVQECWMGHDHSQMSECIEQQAAQARTRLNEVERQMRVSISKSTEGAAYVAAASSSFEASVKAFREYRENQCSLVLVVASRGNGAEENKKACEAQLDAARTAQLQATSWWLQE